jgi:transposase
MKITTIGVDLAKNVFQVHGVDERGRSTALSTINTACSCLASIGK